jgi:hypothetical protein
MGVIISHKLLVNFKVTSITTAASAILATKIFSNVTPISFVPLTLPLLVLPKWALSTFIALCPFEVARIDGSMVAVFMVLVITVVGKVVVAPLSTSDRASPVRKTSATPGAGTLMLQTLLIWSQGTVSMLS